MTPTRLFCTVSGVLTSGALLLASPQAPRPPAPSGAVPSARQLAWHELEFYGFLHFTVNTFTDKEWGYGDEPESVFDPSALDARQWARVARDAGMKGLIITAKHRRVRVVAGRQHDAFGEAQSLEGRPRRRRRRAGAGVPRARAEVWRVSIAVDRNHKDYGRPEYLYYYRAQLRELLTSYGDVFAVWFDGANGGDGFYGGAREKRTIDNSTYYDWANTWSIVRQLQPRAVMFSDAGPDVRWVGNERGVAFETSWGAIDLRGIYPGAAGYTKIAAGTPDGADWAPPEVDVSIRPGWFYHPAEDARVKSVDRLIEIYEQSVGRGANLLLNVPPDRRGLIPDVDAARLREFGAAIAETYKTDLARDARATSATVRGRAAAFDASRVNDGDPSTYWATDDGVTTGSIELEWQHPVEFSRLVLQEHLALGQRVERWTAEAFADGRWSTIGAGTTIGHKRIARVQPTSASRLRVTIAQSRACPVISTIGVYR